MFTLLAFPLDIAYRTKHIL